MMLARLAMGTGRCRPPPHQAAPGSPVHVIHAGDRAVLAGEQDLTGPLRDLVITILAAGRPP